MRSRIGDRRYVTINKYLFNKNGKCKILRSLSREMFDQSLCVRSGMKKILQVGLAGYFYILHLMYNIEGKYQ